MSAEDLVLFEDVFAALAEAAPAPAPGSAPLLIITATGEAGPKGSKRHVGGGRIVESSAKVKPWEETVAWRAIEARTKVRGWRPLLGAVELSMVFTLARPKSHYGTGRNSHLLLPSAPARPDVRPDLDKYVRATQDALQTAKIIRDDGQVVGYRRLAKHYSTDHLRVPDVLDTAGVVIRVWSAHAEVGG
ncbi:RusA family crossover junction endodeoxyribonuclease [Streptomyces sp. ME03-5709C]|nr:RusA family crossover junction endodeoxyribonuclease [Streptomyces sp. ME03-5709C]